MNQLSRNKILLSIIAVLLITNIVMLVLFFRMNRHHPDKKSPGFTERLKKEVGFTEEQMSIYEPKKQLFWDTMRKKFTDIKTTKENFYHFLYNPAVPDSVLEQNADVIGRQQKELDMFVIKHFKEVRKMCKPEQLPKYDSLIPLVIERMTARPKRK